jgi:hypothetical protein
MTKQKVPVSMRAIIQRINRKLAVDDEVLKTTRGERAKFDLGSHFILDWRRNFIVAKYVDPEAYAREIGVLAEWEEVARES